MSIRHPVRCAVATAVLGAAVAAQSFPPGDLFLFSAALTGSSSSGGGLMRIELGSGAANVVRAFQSTPQVRGGMAFDPHRNALLFMASLAPATGIRLWQCDGSGNTQDLGFPNRSFAAFAPTGDGRIYLRDRAESPAGRIHYLDADNQYQTLSDAAGAAPFTLLIGQSSPYECMLYHAASNALLVAQQSAATQDCGGGTSTGLVVRKVLLSLDGTRAVGPIDCVEFEVSSSGEMPVGIDLLPGGDVVVIVDTNSNAAEPRMVRIDPTTMNATPWASNGSYTGAAATNAGCHSAGAAAVVVLDTFQDGLRAYAQGQGGTGTVLPLSAPASAGGSSGESATLVEWRGTACAGHLTGYGNGLGGSGNVVPALVGNGCPVPGATLDLHVSSAIGGGIGLIGFGFGQLAVPLFGGTLLITPDLTTTILLGGVPFAAGQGSAVLPFTLPANPAVSGLHLFAQGAMLDPGAVQGISLTPGLQIVIG